MKNNTKLQKYEKRLNIFYAFIFFMLSFVIAEIGTMIYQINFMLLFHYIWIDINNYFDYMTTSNIHTWIYHGQVYSDFIDRIVFVFKDFIMVLLSGSVMVASFFWMFLNKRLNIKTKDNILRGSRVAPIDILQAEIFSTKDKASFYSIGDIFIPYSYEYRNFMMAGSPGSGKTVQFKKLLKEVRDNKKPFLAYDAKPEYIENFYIDQPTTDKEGNHIPRDIIICPFDQRGVTINLWEEIESDFDYKRIASIIVPSNPNVKDPHWADSARDVFEDILRVLHKYKKMRTNKHLYYYTNISSLDDLRRLLSGTSSFNKLQHDGEAKQVRSSLMNHTRIFKYLSDEGEAFSIKKWIKSNPKNGIFMLARDDMNDVLNPLYNLLLDTYFSAVLSLPDMQDQPDGMHTEYWTFIDEMTDLGKINRLQHFCKKGRSKGSCVAIGVQDIAQLDSLYGEREAQVLRGLFRTWMIFGLGEEVSPKRISDAFGTVEIEEFNQSVSKTKNPTTNLYSHTTNQSPQRKVVAAVLPSEISQLADLEFFLRFRGDFPIAKGKIKYVSYPKIAESLILNDLAKCQPSISESDVEIDNVFKEETTVTETKPIDEKNNNVESEADENKIDRKEVVKNQEITDNKKRVNKASSVGDLL